MKVIYQFDTGDTVPEDAVHLGTVRKEWPNIDDMPGTGTITVAHYFLVEVEDDEVIIEK